MCALKLREETDRLASIAGPWGLSEAGHLLFARGTEAGTQRDECDIRMPDRISVDLPSKFINILNDKKSDDMPDRMSEAKIERLAIVILNIMS